ncbi:hypothetical protein AVEN_61436-1 [Araneus ventricosus]|uniref:DDE-1 domain-containing protein n=1 Tax=Araneus ventricosus TaxID=182803 RepID=A0A4Y2M972_ARAVE|nr:hypothetical protein AVEN_61436-1 [Araneus ventricosus]
MLQTKKNPMAPQEVGVDRLGGCSLEFRNVTVHYRGVVACSPNGRGVNNDSDNKPCSESASAPESVCEECIKDIPALVKGYEQKNIFKADETGLFHQCLSDKTVMFKDEECRGGKQSRVHLTVLLAANEDESEKLPPLMIGRSKKPRSLARDESDLVFPFQVQSQHESLDYKWNLWGLVKILRRIYASEKEENYSFHR